MALTVAGGGGSAAAVQPGYVTVEVPAGGIDDGGFEGQVRGGAPLAPWGVVGGGTAHVIDPVGPATDNAMPVDGAQWLELSTDGTFDALPPTVPGGETAPAVGGAGVSQTFSYPAGEPVLELVAAFMLDGTPASASFNDWMSVDVDDGVTTHNVFYPATRSLRSRARRPSTVYR